MTINKFKDAMQSNGISCNEIIISDGQIHRFSNGKERNKNGWYASHNNGEFGAFGDFKLGLDVRYSSKNGGELTQEERATIDREMEASKQKKLAGWDKTSLLAIQALEILCNKGYSEYLVKKQVKSYGLLFDNLNTIYIPMRDIDGKIWSYQQIYQNGNKRFLKGGKKQGTFHAIGKYPTDKIILCEGYATGASVYEATGITAIVCFDAGNIITVSKAINAKDIIIAGDNDVAGIKACKATGHKYFIPEQEKYDFNDVCVNYGLPAVKKYFIEPVKDKITYPDGLVGDIARWITESSIYPQPVLSISSALTLVGALKGHKVRSETDLRTNLYTISIAPSGAGKDQPRKMVEKILLNKTLNNKQNENRKAVNLLLGEPASGSGLLIALHENNGKALLQIDEFGRMLGRVANVKAGSYQTEIIDCFLKLFSSANSIMIGKEYASKDMQNRKDIYQPCLCLNGNSVSSHLYGNLKSTEILDGFLNRFLVFESKTRPEEQIPSFKSIPQHIISQIEIILDMPFNVETGSNLHFEPADIEIIPRTIEFSEDARELLISYKQDIREIMLKMDKENNPLVALYARLIEHTIKLALIICDNTIINKSNLEWAINTVKICTENLAEGCKHNISDNFLEEESKKVLIIVKEHKAITKGELVRKTQFLNRKRRNEILEDLLEGNRITINKIENKTKHIFQISFLK